MRRRFVAWWQARRNPPCQNVAKRVEEWTDPLDLYPASGGRHE